MPPTPRYEQYGNLGIVEIYREKERERDMEIARMPHCFYMGDRPRIVGSSRGGGA